MRAVGEDSPAEGSVNKLLPLLLYDKKWETATTGYVSVDGDNKK